jgi:hypothetical protein
VAPSQFFLLSRGFWEVERASGEEGEQRVLLEGRGGGGLKVVVIFGREGQGWGGWGHRRHGRGVGKLGALQEACSGNPPRDVNALSKRGPNPNPNSVLFGKDVMSKSHCVSPLYIYIKIKKYKT